jgi:hypothetical protein
MAKASATSIEGQLIAARARHLGGQMEGALADALVRLEDLRKAIQAIDEIKSTELYRYFPVAAIAVLETHFKATVQAIVDAGSPYLERGLVLTKDRFKSFSEILPSLHRKTITVGELIAHQLPFNSVASIEDPIGALLGGDFKKILAAVCDPFCVRREIECSPIVEDINTLWRDLAETFERRHILAHEAATTYVVTPAQALTAVDCVTTLAMAIDALLWETVWKEQPLTQVEMRDDAAKRYGESRHRLAQSLRLARQYAKKRNRQQEFYRLHRVWKQYAEQWARWEVEDYGMGSMRRLVGYTARERVYSARERDIEDWLSSFEPMSYL